MRRLIVNADDCALTQGVTDGILEAHRHGIVTSTSVIAQGAAFDYAVPQLRAAASLEVGVHLTLVEERTLSDPRRVPSLAGPSGKLPATYAALLAGLTCGRIRWPDVETELRAQVAACLGAGLRITHLDSHQHVHAWPPLLRRVLAIAADFAIPSIRLPLDTPRLAWTAAEASKSLLCLLARFDVWALAPRRTRRSDRMAGLFESGHLTEARLLRILDRLPEGATELVCHPGRADAACHQAYGHWRYHWDTELAALISPAVRNRVRERGIQLAFPACGTPLEYQSATRPATRA